MTYLPSRPMAATSASISDFVPAVRANRLDQMAVPGADLAMAGYTLTGLNVAPSVAGMAAEYSWTIGQIQAAINSLVNGAPATLATLKAIDTQLASDESAAAVLTNAVAGKLAIASNLSDLASIATARSNLGLGTAATHPATDFLSAGQAVNTPVSNTYTASGAIAITDSFAIVNAASAAAMTLAAGTVDGHDITIKRWGAGTVSVAATIDNVAQTLAMTSATVQESLTLRWSTSLNSYVLI